MSLPCTDDGKGGLREALRNAGLLSSALLCSRAIDEAGGFS